MRREPSPCTCRDSSTERKTSSAKLSSAKLSSSPDLTSSPDLKSSVALWTILLAVAAVRSAASELSAQVDDDVEPVAGGAGLAPPCGLKSRPAETVPFKMHANPIWREHAGMRGLL